MTHSQRQDTLTTAPEAPAPPPSEAPAGPQPAKWWSRVGATIFDGFLVGLPIVIIAVAIGVYDEGTRTVQLITSVAGVIYAAAMLAHHRGQTVGKQVASVRCCARTAARSGSDARSAASC